MVAIRCDHDKKKQTGNTEFSSNALLISFSNHAGTHVDAPAHLDAYPIEQMPFERFYTSAICLDLSHTPLRHAVTMPEM